MSSSVPFAAQTVSVFYQGACCGYDYESRTVANDGTPGAWIRGSRFCAEFAPPTGGAGGGVGGGFTATYIPFAFFEFRLVAQGGGEPAGSPAHTETSIEPDSPGSSTLVPKTRSSIPLGAAAPSGPARRLSAGLLDVSGPLSADLAKPTALSFRGPDADEASVSVKYETGPSANPVDVIRRVATPDFIAEVVPPTGATLFDAASFEIHIYAKSQLVGNLPESGAASYTGDPLAAYLYETVSTTGGDALKITESLPSVAARTTLVEPVADGFKTTEDSRILHRFLGRLQHVTVLDPACGSGNFLYVTLGKLKDLEKEVIVHGLECGFSGSLPLVGPWQLHGIELNPFAHDLAQTAVWIGHLQWTRANGFQVSQDPVLRPMDKNFLRMDAILNRRPGEPACEPEWSATEFVVGNPPFLGGKILRSELGDDYVDAMFDCWKGRVAAESDLCCYWFEKARNQLVAGKARRVGLLATQGIRGGANRKVLKRIKKSGDIFFAVSDREWILDGANVHISMVGFDDGGETERSLDGQSVPEIHSNLTATAADLTSAIRIPANLDIAFMGSTKGGAFDIAEATALEWLAAPNPHGIPNSEVVVPWINGMDVTRRPRGMWIIDYGKNRSEAEASRFEAPFSHLRQHVLPKRLDNKRDAYRRLWWQHVEARPAMFAALAPLERFLATARVAKHRLFAWCQAPVVPDCQIIVFARADDFFFGVLHSKVHELWALAQGTQLREKESGFRYTPTTCFETFPFPDPGVQQHDAVAVAARELNELRERWLNPPEWTREEVLEFPATPGGPWARFVAPGTTTARYPRLVPIDDAHAAKLKKRTLTKLYNERPAWLVHAHEALDAAVLAAYGWSADLPDPEILSRLLVLNQKYGSQPSGSSASASGTAAT